MIQFFTSRTSISAFIVSRCTITFFLTIAFFTQQSNAQTAPSSDKYILWKGVKIYEFKYAGNPDTLENCGEWITKGNATKLSELNKRMLNKIAMTVKKDNCNIVFVDLKNFWGAKEAWPEGIYCLGFKKKN